MTYLLAILILANGQIVSLPTVVFGGVQACEVGKTKLIKDIERQARGTIVIASCLDR